MPGAYTKHMEGERYERLCVAVQDCAKLIHSLDRLVADEIQKNISRILLLVVDYSKDSIEEFVYAKGLSLFCSIVKERSKHRWIGDIRAILRFLSILLVHQVDTFDENLGVMPMLTYFLCERHTHSIDIEWSEHELILMKEFLESQFALLTSHASSHISDEDQSTSFQLLLGVLMSYPAHRVMNSCLSVFSPEMCTQLFEHLQHSPFLWETAKGKLQLAQFLFFLTSFGLGPLISADLSLSLLMITLQSNLLPQLRCPCTHCEFIRRIQRVARERDEFGVQKAAESKRKLCFILIRSRIIDILYRLLKATVQECSFEEENVEQVSAESTTVSCNEPTDCLQEKNDGTSSCQETAWELKNKFASGAIACLHHSSDYLIDTTNAYLLYDRILRFISLTILLCSFAYEELYHGESILLDGSGRIFFTFLEYFQGRSIHKLWNDSSLEWNPGARIALQMLCTLTLKSPISERNKFSLHLEKPLADMLKETSHRLVMLCGPSSRDWKPQMGHLIPTLSIALLTVTVAVQDDQKKAEVWQPFEDELMDHVVKAVLTFQEGFAYGSSSMDHRVFMKCLLMSMALLTGVHRYLQWPETRRLFFPRAHPKTGSFASSARWMLQTYRDTLASGDGCIIMKTLASFVISRAEKASCVISRPELAKLLLKNHYSLYPALSLS